MVKIKDGRVLMIHHVYQRKQGCGVGSRSTYDNNHSLGGDTKAEKGPQMTDWWASEGFRKLSPTIHDETTQIVTCVSKIFTCVAPSSQKSELSDFGICYGERFPPEPRWLRIVVKEKYQDVQARKSANNKASTQVCRIRIVRRSRKCYILRPAKFAKNIDCRWEGGDG